MPSPASKPSSRRSAAGPRPRLHPGVLPRRGRPPGGLSPATSDQILVAALRAFAGKGYDGTSVREINQQLGVSHNLINRRFGSKEKLWYATIDRHFGDLAAELARSLSPEDGRGDLLGGLRRFIVAFILANARRPELFPLMNIEASIDGPRLDYIYERYAAPFVTAVRGILEQLAERGETRPVPMPTFFFLLAHGATAAVALRPLARKVGVTDPDDPAFQASHAEAVADLILDGIRVKAARAR